MARRSANQQATKSTMSRKENQPIRPDTPTNFWQQYWQQCLKVNCAFTRAVARAGLARLDTPHEIAGDQNPAQASPTNSPDSKHSNPREVSEMATPRSRSSEGRRQDENHSR